MSRAHLEPAPDFWGVFNFRAQMSSKKSSKPNRPLKKNGIPGLLTHKLLYPISLVLWRTLTHFSERHFWGLVNRYVVLLHLVIWIDVLMEFPLFHIELPENSGCPNGSWRHFVPRGSRWTAVLPRTLRKSHVLELWEDHRILLTDWQGWTQATVRLVSA